MSDQNLKDFLTLLAADDEAAKTVTDIAKLMGYDVEQEDIAALVKELGIEVPTARPLPPEQPTITTCGGGGEPEKNFGRGDFLKPNSPS